jgi:hypothetical protein
VFHRERGPKTRAAASSVGGITEWEVISYRGVAVVDEYGHFQANPPHRLAGILLRSTTRISTGSAAFWPPLLMPEPPARNQRATLVALDAVAGRRDGLAVRWLASRTRWLPTSRDILHPRNRVPARCGRRPDRDPDDPPLILGRWDRPHRPPRGALTGLLVGCLLAAAMLPLISWLWHDPARRDINTQIEAAVGGQGSSSRS